MMRSKHVILQVIWKSCSSSKSIRIN